MAGHKPTDEQRIAVETFATGRPLKIAAFAGAGKTATLRMLAESRQERGVYLAFNRSIATEAQAKFPPTVDCRTTHSIAYRTVMPNYQSSAKMTKTLHAKQLAAIKEYRDLIFSGPLRLNSVQQAHLVLGTVRRFCQSADSEIELSHVPTYGRLLGAKKEVVEEIQVWAVQEGKGLWQRMTSRGGDVPLGHDGYLKLWALGRPKLAANYILLDEAQDTNGVVLGVLKEQDAQTVFVGDRHQQIYEWRGAINAMEKIKDCEEAVLTQSFRFGEVLADAASRVLATLGEGRRIRGNPTIESSVLANGQARTVLARTNATVIQEVLDAISSGLKPYVVGGTKDLERLVSDVYELKAGKPGDCPEFFGFENWIDVVAFSETEEGEPIRMFVQLIERYGEGALWAAIKSTQDNEDHADVILSTAHKAKGCEWDSVRLASDFANSRLGSHPGANSEVRLFYVAMTRARENLIVAPEVLELFSTDAWKSKELVRRRARTAVPPDLARNEPGRLLRESSADLIANSSARQRYPAVERRPAHEQAEPSQTVQTNPGDLQVGIRWGTQSQTSSAPPPLPDRVAATQPVQSPPRRGIWGRIARFFE